MSPERREYPLSKGAQGLIGRAKQVGVDSSHYVRRAIENFERIGRNGKVGPFGPGKEPFKDLKTAIDHAASPFFK